MTMRIVWNVLAVVLLITPRTSLAQTTGRAAEESRIFLDVNLSGTDRPLASDRTFTSLFGIFGEIGSAHATYPKPSRAGMSSLVDLGGGYMLTRVLGIGVGHSRTSYEDVVRLGAAIPHPTFLNASAVDIGVTDRALPRREVATNVFLALVVGRTSRWQVRVSGGPSFFSYRAEMVNGVSYAQAFDPLAMRNAITITGFTSEKVRGHAIGWHAGGDVTYFLTKILGVGAGVRFSRGTVTVDEEPLSKVSQQFRVGRTIGFAGARFRFGG